MPRELLLEEKAWSTPIGSVVTLHNIVGIIGLDYLFPFESHSQPYYMYDVTE